MAVNGNKRSRTDSLDGADPGTPDAILDPSLMLTPRARERELKRRALELSPSHRSPARLIRSPNAPTYRFEESSPLVKSPLSFMAIESNIARSSTGSASSPVPPHTDDELTLATPPRLKFLEEVENEDDDLDPPPVLSSLSSKALFEELPHFDLMPSTPSFSFASARKERQELIRNFDVLSTARRSLRKGTTPSASNSPSSESLASRLSGQGSHESRSHESRSQGSRSQESHIQHRIASPFSRYERPQQPHFEPPVWTAEHWKMLHRLVGPLLPELVKDLDNLPRLPADVLVPFRQFNPLEVSGRALALARQRSRSASNEIA